MVMKRWGRHVRLFELVQSLDVHLLLIMGLFGASKVYVVIVTQSIMTLGHSMDCSQSGSSAHGLLQARILEWVAIFFSRLMCIPSFIICWSIQSKQFPFFPILITQFFQHIRVWFSLT